MVICIFKAIVAWGIMAFIGTNLVGLVVRGALWMRPPMDAPTDRLAAYEHGKCPDDNPLPCFRGGASPHNTLLLWDRCCHSCMRDYRFSCPGPSVGDSLGRAPSFAERAKRRWVYHR